MTRQGVSTLPMLLSIDRHARDGALYRQLYRALRAEILEGRLVPGARLPGSRVLANDLGLSRATILAAYDELAAEGYIVGRRGGGTRVAAGIPRIRPASALEDYDGDTIVSPPVDVSLLGARMIADHGDPSPRAPVNRAIPFVLGVPALDDFPIAIWMRLTARRWRETPRAMLASDDGPGYAPLRQAIAEYVVTARAVRCTQDQVVITAGGQQGIDLIARLLVNPGDAVWLEEYGYPPARAIFAGVGAHGVGVPVDEEGLDVAGAMRLAASARVALVTPACAAPLGVTMSLRRRLALLEWAHRNRAWIIEDDYNGEFRYEGKPLSALQGLEHPGARRVIYLRTFSRTLFPALRLGYAVLPRELVEMFTRARFVADRHSPTAEQAVLADFIVGGHFARHVRNMRSLYAARQRVLLDLASAALGDRLRIHAAPAGMSVLGRLPPGICDRMVAVEAARRGVIVEPLSLRAMNPSDQRGLFLGYTPFGAAETRRALAQLALAIQVVAEGHSLPSAPPIGMSTSSEASRRRRRD